MTLPLYSLSHDFVDCTDVKAPVLGESYRRRRRKTSFVTVALFPPTLAEGILDTADRLREFRICSIHYGRVDHVVQIFLHQPANLVGQKQGEPVHEGEAGREDDNILFPEDPCDHLLGCHLHVH